MFHCGRSPQGDASKGVPIRWTGQLEDAVAAEARDLAGAVAAQPFADGCAEMIQVASFMDYGVGRARRCKSRPCAIGIVEEVFQCLSQQPVSRRGAAAVSVEQPAMVRGRVEDVANFKGDFAEWQLEYGRGFGKLPQEPIHGRRFIADAD